VPLSKGSLGRASGIQQKLIPVPGREQEPHRRQSAPNSSSMPSTSRKNSTTSTLARHPSGKLDFVAVPSAAVSSLTASFECRVGGPPRQVLRRPGELEDLTRPLPVSHVSSLRESMRRRKLVKLVPLDLPTLAVERPRSHKAVMLPPSIDEEMSEMSPLSASPMSLIVISSPKGTLASGIAQQGAGGFSSDLQPAAALATASPSRSRRVKLSSARSLKAEVTPRCPVLAEGLVSAKEILKRSLATSAGFAEEELRRMRQAFNRFKAPDGSELNRADLEHAITHLGYIGVTDEAVMEVAMQVSSYSTLSFQEFVSFVEQYACREKADIGQSFSRHAKGEIPMVSEESLPALLHELGFAVSRNAIGESLASAGFAKDKTKVRSLDLERLMVFLAVLRSAEGFGSDEVHKALAVFDKVSRPVLGRPRFREMSIALLSEAMGQLFGHELIEKCQELMKQLLPDYGDEEDESEDEDEDDDESPVANDLEDIVPARPNYRAINFHEFLIWARRLRVKELHELWGGFAGADADGDGLVLIGDLLPLLPGYGTTFLDCHVNGLLAVAGGGVDKLVRPDSIDGENLVSDSDLTRLVCKACVEVFKKFDYDLSGKIDVLELLDMLRYLGYSTSLEEVHRILKIVDSDGNGELDFQEFLSLMRLHRESQVKDVRKMFDKLTAVDDARDDGPDVDAQSDDSDAFVNKIEARMYAYTLDTLKTPRCQGPQLRWDKFGAFLTELGIHPGDLRLREILVQMGKPQELSFDSVFVLSERCRHATSEVMRKNAGFPERHVRVLEKLFKVHSAKAESTVIERGGFTRLLGDLGVSMSNHEDREEMFRALDPARRAAKAAGASEAEAGELGSSTVTFSTLLHLLRGLAHHGQRRVIEREMKAMESVGWSHAEVTEFREVFTSMVAGADRSSGLAAPSFGSPEKKSLRSRARSDEAEADVPLSPKSRRHSAPSVQLSAVDFAAIRHPATLSEVKADLYLKNRGPQVCVRDVVTMLRCLGLKLNFEQRTELNGQAHELAGRTIGSGGDKSGEDTPVVDFAVYLRLVRWILEANFGDVNGIAAKITGVNTMQAICSFTCQWGYRRGEAASWFYPFS
ncbi:unnamed protein product, partial [Polarella glacialis]